MTWTLTTGDCLEILPTLEADSIDACVTDPPYGWDMMGKKWDHGVPGTAYWTEVLRVLKPGGWLLAFGGPRTHHRLMAAIEDAGFELRDCFCWLFGSGFPKALNVSKAIDKAAGAKRKVIGQGPYARRSVPRANKTTQGFVFADDSYIRPPGQPITAPATPEAKLWDGWHTALKPAHEPVIWAQKPLTVIQPPRKLLEQLEILLGGLLCQLLSSAKSVELLLQSVPQGLATAPRASALLLAAVLHGGQSEKWSEKMAMFNSPEAVSTIWNTVWLWNTISVALFQNENTFTTSTATELTIALKTLNSYLSKNTPPNIIRAVSLPVGELLPANIAANHSSEELPGKQGCYENFAAALATLRQVYINANGAEQNFMAGVHAANSVLFDAVQILNENTPNNLHPAYEPIILAMKPLDGTFAQNALTHGVAGLNVDGCRVPFSSNEPYDIKKKCRPNIPIGTVYKQNAYGERPTIPVNVNNKGRWPANVVLDEEAGAMLDEQTGVLHTHPGKFSGHVGYGKKTKQRRIRTAIADSGGASRFFYCAKASRSERTADNTITNDHPTIKPLALMRWLCRLVSTPTGGTILDPFAGSGSTGVAALQEGLSFVGIELEAEYADIARARLEKTSPDPEQLNLAL